MAVVEPQSAWYPTAMATPQSQQFRTHQGHADLSIVIPALNEEAFLPKLLASIAEQTVQPREVIVADAHSTDRTAQIAREAGAKVVPGGRPAESRNAGAAVAQGTYLLFLDADIVLPSDFIATLLSSFDREYYEIATAPFLADSQLRIDDLIFALQVRAMDLLGEFYPFAHGSIILTTARLHHRIGGFRTNLTIGEDTDYGRRAKAIARFGTITTTHASMSARRLEKEGRLALLRKYLRHGLLRQLEPFGISAQVEYEFGQFDSTKNLSSVEALLEDILQMLPAKPRRRVPQHNAPGPRDLQ